MMITGHFSAEEFACHDGTPYPCNMVDTFLPSRTWRESRLLPLCQTLEEIRAAADGPIHIVSGYRTMTYDAKLYAADRGAGNVAMPSGSQHPKGRAADIACLMMSPAKLHEIILSLFMAGRLPRLGGLGLYPTFVHVDVRPRIGDHLARWTGTRLTNVL